LTKALVPTLVVIRGTGGAERPLPLNLRELGSVMNIFGKKRLTSMVSCAG
jgi:hypothetical protein